MKSTIQKSLETDFTRRVGIKMQSPKALDYDMLPIE